MIFIDEKSISFGKRSSHIIYNISMIELSE
jgi:hypothetical protein